MSELPEIDRAAGELYARAPQLARDYLTEYSARKAARTVKRWTKLAQDLFVKYLDGNVRNELGKVTHPGYPEAWYRRIVKENGEHFRIRKIKGEPEEPEKPDARPSLGGYFQSRAELGALASLVPADLSFDREKLLLLPGTARCGQPPRCCLVPQPGPKAGELVVTVKRIVPQQAHAVERLKQCGEAGWLVRLPKG